MPFFFFLSGYLFRLTRRTDRSLKEIVLKNFLRLVLPYWTTVLVIVIYSHTILVHIKHITLKYDPFRLYASLLYGSGVPVQQFPGLTSYTTLMWFLLALFTSNIVFWMLLKLVRERGLLLQALVIAVTTWTGLIVGRHIFLPWSTDIALVSQIFLFAGYVTNGQHIFKQDVKSLCIIVLCLCISIVDVRMGGISMNNRQYNNIVVSAAGGISGSILLCYFSHFLSSISVRVSAKATNFFATSVDTIISGISYCGKESLIILCYQLIETPWLWLTMQEVESLKKTWIYLTLFRLFYCVVIIEVIYKIPILRSLYNWQRYPLSASRSNGTG